METSAKTAMNVNEIFMAIGTISSLLLTLFKPGAKHSNKIPVSTAAKNAQPDATPNHSNTAGDLIQFKSSMFMKNFLFDLSL